LAINQNEPLARSQGISAFRYQILAFAISALLAGLAGGLYVFHLTIVDPSVFDAYYTQMMLIIVILGGAGFFWPVIAMAAVFTIVPEVLRLAPELRMILVGIVLVAAIQFFPQGFGGYLADRRTQAWNKRN
jgi:branched-chain amino acid transport system permease protein